jgi:hypothetical protein
VIESIFLDDCEISEDRKSIRIFVPDRSASPGLLLGLHFPERGYPSSVAPLIDLHAPHVPDGSIESLIDEMHDLFLPGEVRCRCKLQLALHD